MQDNDKCGLSTYINQVFPIMATQEISTTITKDTPFVFNLKFESHRLYKHRAQQHHDRQHGYTRQNLSSTTSTDLAVAAYHRLYSAYHLNLITTIIMADQKAKEQARIELEASQKAQIYRPLNFDSTTEDTDTTANKPLANLASTSALSQTGNKPGPNRQVNLYRAISLHSHHAKIEKVYRQPKFYEQFDEEEDEDTESEEDLKHKAGVLKKFLKKTKALFLGIAPKASSRDARDYISAREQAAREFPARNSQNESRGG